MSLRRDGMRGGLYLGSREAGGIVIRLVGVLLLTRLIGPADYGFYAGSLAVVYVLTTLAQLGTEAYLMRLPADEATPDRFHQAFSLVLVSSTIVTLVAICGALVVGSLVDRADFTWPFILLCFSIPVNALWAPSQAIIERDLRYRTMALLEVGSDAILYGVALPLAFLNAGVWAPIAGWIASQTWLFIGSAWQAHFRPRWHWSSKEARSMTRYGIGYASGNWILTRPTEIVNPLIIGPQLGAAAVGQVALALRLIDTLGFVQRATQRISLVMFGRVQHDTSRLRRAVVDTTALQLLAIGVPLAGFGLVASDVVPWMFGDEWREAAVIYPIFALAFFLSAVFNVQSYALSVLRRNAPIVIGSVLQLALLVAGAAILVPRYELDGLGAARLISIAGLVVIPLALRSNGASAIGPGIVWIIGLTPVIAVSSASWSWRIPAVVFALCTLLVPAARRQLFSLLSLLRRDSHPSNRDPGNANNPAAVTPESGSVQP
jgi:O-antigen/teichoic acid export membrane protein